MLIKDVGINTEAYVFMCILAGAIKLLMQVFWQYYEPAYELLKLQLAFETCHKAIFSIQFIYLFVSRDNL